MYDTETTPLIQRPRGRLHNLGTINASFLPGVCARVKQIGAEYKESSGNRG